MFVCTPSWLLENKKQEEIIFSKNYLIVFEYNYNKIQKYIEFIEGKSWEEIALKINRIASWEFEDYIE